MRVERVSSALRLELRKWSWKLEIERLHSGRQEHPIDSEEFA